MKIKFSGGQPQAFSQPWSNSVPARQGAPVVTQSEAVRYLLLLMTEMRDEIGDLKKKLAAFGVEE